MFKSLRGRLLLSYAVVIATALLVIIGSAFVVGSLPAVRYVPTLRELDAISRTSRSELLRLLQTRAGDELLLRVLDQTAVDNDVRVLVVRAEDRQIIYDTSDNEWLGVTVTGVELPPRLLTTIEPNAIAGLFTHPGGSNWLVYSRPISSSGFGRLFILFATPEPTRLVLFRELGLFNIFLLSGAGCIAFLLAILLAFGIVSWISQPLRQMATAAEAIAQGEYEQQIPPQGPEEVQRVAHSFNSMAAQVAATRQAQRDFVANVSHDLKTPITSIQGWSQALLDGTAVSPAVQQQAAVVIHSEAERMSRMVRQLLDLARIESGQLALHKTAVDLVQLVSDVQRSFLLRAQEQQIQLTLATTPAPRINGDPDRLTQVFTNLVENAFTHTPAGGRVHLDVHPHGAQGVEVVVQDTGKGIPPADLSRIFERFYQVDKSRAKPHAQQRRAGSGLGLAIVNELVTLHNGRLHVHSEVGKGSAFVVHLPVGESAEE